MANGYLISKWRHWFSLFDANDDGKVCFTDMEKARDRFTKQHDLNDDEKKEICDKFSKWWCEYVNWGKEELTVDEFVEYQNAAFKADKEKFIERIKKCQAEIGDFLDVAHDGFLSEKEIIAMLKAEGHADEEKDKRFYAHFSPVDGKVPLDRMLGYWIHYLTSEDSSLPDPVQQAIEEGL